MASIQADYPDGGYRTRVSATPGVDLGGGGGLGDMGWLMQLAKRRAQQKLRMGDFEYDMATRARRDMYGPKLGTWDSPQGAANVANRTGISQARDAAAMSGATRRAATGGPPMKMTYSPGGLSSYMPDVNAMTGIQRQFFLPGGSGEIGGPVSNIERGEFSASRGRQRGDLAGIMEVLALQAGATPGYGGAGEVGPGTPPPGPTPYWLQEEERRRARNQRLASGY